MCLISLAKKNEKNMGFVEFEMHLDGKKCVKSKL